MTSPEPTVPAPSPLPLPPRPPAASRPERRPLSPRRSAVEELTSTAGGLWIAFQPLYELSKGRRAIHAVECLVRGPRGTRLEAPEELYRFFGRRGELHDLNRLSRPAGSRPAATSRRPSAAASTSPRGSSYAR